MNPRTLQAIEVALKERPGDWAERIAQALLNGGLTAASPEELAPIVAEEFAALGPESDYDEFEWAAEAALYRSPVLADRAAVALRYSLPQPDPVVIVDWDDRPYASIFSDGSLLDEGLRPWNCWADWVDAQIEPGEFAITSRGDAGAAERIREALRQAGHTAD